MFLVNDDVDAKEQDISDADQEIIVDALEMLKKDKVQALESLKDHPGRPFTEADMGIPAINRLIKMFNQE